MREPPASLRLIGRSRAMERLRRLIARVAPTDATVLVLGERGTGKEMVAREIHRLSRRAERPFVAVNCAALPVELAASELFGHERGAFTGAHERAPGLVRAAAGGTLFLDEVGDLSPASQAMLLRFLQDREVRAVGSKDTVHVDVRVIAATNRDLEQASARGDFRADLYDRLAEVVLTVPPLRDRGGDIPELLEHFVALKSASHGKRDRRVAPATVRALVEYTWPGNVRQLEAAVSRAVIFADGQWMRLPDFGVPVGRDHEAACDVIAADESSDRLTARQGQALALARERGVVRRREIVARFGVSTEAARRDLVRLVQLRRLVPSGAGRGSEYRPV